MIRRTCLLGLMLLLAIPAAAQFNTIWGQTTGASCASPAGTGSELQYRLSASTLGAVTGSSVSGGGFTLFGGISLTNADSSALTDLLINPAVKTSGNFISAGVASAPTFLVDYQGNLAAGNIFPGGHGVTTTNWPYLSSNANSVSFFIGTNDVVDIYRGAYTGLNISFAGNTSLTTRLFVASASTSVDATLNTGNVLTTTSSILPASSIIKYISYSVPGAAITTCTSYTIKPSAGSSWVNIGTATTAQTGVAQGSTGVLVPPSNLVYYTSSADTISITCNSIAGAGMLRFVIGFETPGIP